MYQMAVEVDENFN